MPSEDVLTYKVEIDPSDIGAQLDQIRAQVDLAMGSFAFSQAPTAPGLSMSMTPGGDLGAMVANTDTGFAATAMQFAQASGGELSTFLNHNYNAFKLGYSKFTSGMERMGLMVPPSPMIQFPQEGLTDFTRQMEALQAVGMPGGPFFSATGMQGLEMPGLIPGALGLGYDPDRMPMSRLEFQEHYGGAFGKRTRDLLESNAGFFAGTAAGAAIGAAGGPIGAIAGGTVGMLGDLTLGWLGQQRRQEEQVGGALQSISKHTLMREALTSTQGSAMAERLLGVADSYDSRVTRLSRDDIQSELLGFTQGGGFDAARSAEEFETIAKGVIDNTRKVMRSLKMTQDEAVTFMAEMQREGLVNTNDAGMFSLDIATSAQASGMSPMNMMNFVRQGSEMYRGSGVGMVGGMQMLQEARLTVQQMVQDTGSGLTVARELGGADSAAIALAQGQTNFMQSAMGLVQYNNMQHGGASTDWIAAMGNMSGTSPFDVYRMRANIDQDMGAGRLNPQQMASFQLDPYLQRYSQALKLSEGRGMEAGDYEAFMYFMEQNTGMPLPEVRQLFMTRFGDPTETVDRKLSALESGMRAVGRPEPVSKWDSAMANAGLFIDTVIEPGRGLERAFHSTFDAIETGITDWYLDRQQLSLGGANTIHNQSQRNVIDRYLEGTSNKQEQALIDQSSDLWTTTTKSASPEFFVSQDNYLRYGNDTTSWNARAVEIYKMLPGGELSSRVDSVNKIAANLNKELTYSTATTGGDILLDNTNMALSMFSTAISSTATLAQPSFAATPYMAEDGSLMVALTDSSPMLSGEGVVTGQLKQKTSQTNKLVGQSWQQKNSLTQDYVNTVASIFTRADGQNKAQIMTNFIAALSAEKDMPSAISTLGLATANAAEAAKNNEGLFKENQALAQYNTLLTTNNRVGDFNKLKKDKQDLAWTNINQNLMQNLATVSEDHDGYVLNALNSATNALASAGAISVDPGIDDLYQFGDISADQLSEMGAVAGFLEKSMGASWYSKHVTGVGVGSTSLRTKTGKFEGYLGTDLDLTTAARHGISVAAMQLLNTQLEAKHSSYQALDPLAQGDAQYTANLHDRVGNTGKAMSLLSKAPWVVATPYIGKAVAGAAVAADWLAGTQSNLGAVLSTLEKDATYSGLFPDGTKAVADMNAKEQQALLVEMTKHNMGDNGDSAVANAIHTEEQRLYNSKDAYDQNLVAAFTKVGVTADFLSEQLTAAGQAFGLDITSGSDLNVSKALLTGMTQQLEKQQTYAGIRTGKATFAEIKEYKAEILATQQLRSTAANEADKIQEMINQMSPNMSPDDRTKLVGKYGAMFGDVKQVEAASDLREEVDKRIGKLDEVDDVDTLLLKTIADSLDRLITVTARKS